MDMAKLVKPLVWKTRRYKQPDQIGHHSGTYAIWQDPKTLACVASSGAPYFFGPVHAADLEAAQAAANADHAARVIAALDGDAVRELVEFLGDFGRAKIDALRHDRGRSSPEDDPDPVVDAEPVWGWQEDARAILAKLGLTP